MKMSLSNVLVRFVGALVIFAWNMVPAQATAVLSIDPSSVNVTAGDTFSVKVDISGVTDLFAFEFDIGFDPTVLSANSISEGPFLSTGGPTLWIPGSIDNIGGAITANADTLQNLVSGVAGSGVLATIDFTALAAGSSGITVFNAILLGSYLVDIPTDSPINGNVTVAERPTPTPEPTTVALLGLGFAAMRYQRRKRLST